jgi:uncharacterized phage protein (TIGR01671 family)
MREILFRGKPIKSGRGWIYGDLYQSRQLERVCITDYDTRGNYIEYPIKPETLGQYTGLKDKYGRKIFEGDILRTGTRMGYILFEKGCFRFRWKNFDRYRGDFFKTCIITEYGSFRELEVIGNIHDNPEMLKGGAE